jgi:hypothetical protein
VTDTRESARTADPIAADRLGAFLDAYDETPCTCGEDECAGREDFILGIRATDGTTRDLYASDLRTLRAEHKQQAAELATLRDVFSTLTPLVQQLWNVTWAQFKPAWNALAPLLEQSDQAAAAD